MEPQRLYDISTAIRVIGGTKKPNVKDVEAETGFDLTAAERDEAWKFIGDNPVDDDIPQNGEGTDSNIETGDSVNDDDNQPLDDETIYVLLSPRAKVAGLERRCRAGHCFDKDGTTLTIADLDEDQIKAIEDDKYLSVK